MHTSKEWVKVTPQNQDIVRRYQNEYQVKLGGLAKELGIQVKLATLPANISGEIKESNGVTTIRINRHDVKARQRYTLAHEIAHFLLHRHLLRDGISDDVLYRSKHSNSIEVEANCLGADIIMPMHLVQSLLTKHSVDKKDNSLYEAIAEELGVSTIALKHRLGKN